MLCFNCNAGPGDVNGSWYEDIFVFLIVFDLLSMLNASGGKELIAETND